MKIKSAAATIVAISLAAAGLANAQGYGNDRRGHDYDRRGGDARQYDRDRGHGDYRGREEWRRGGRLPAEYRHRQYVVDDWRGHHLRPPPRGYHWVQHGSDYVLVAITTGIIADILLNHR